MLFRLCRAMWESDGSVLLFGLSSTVAHCSVGLGNSSMWLLHMYRPPLHVEYTHPHGTYTSHECELPKGAQEMKMLCKSCNHFASPL